jgi:hypothetical protein
LPEKCRYRQQRWEWGKTGKKYRKVELRKRKKRKKALLDQLHHVPCGLPIKSITWKPTEAYLPVTFSFTIMQTAGIFSQAGQASLPAVP